MPFPTLSRRHFLAAGASVAGLSALPRPLRAAASTAPIQLIAKQRPGLLPGRLAPSPLWTYAETWPLELRIKRNEPVSITLLNQLQEHTAIHWHGLRIPIAMDGVPYVTQPPIEPGESFTYRFTPPDPGTFFFHPHCNTVEALGRGLAGVLIVEDPREDGLFDLDQTIALKDWRVKDDGSFLPFQTDRGAAKAGTFGTLRSVNGGDAPIIPVRPNGRVRLRVLNIDVTRVSHLGAKGAEISIIATDGNACDPFPVEGWRLGPAMRADLSFLAPAQPGAEVVLYDTRAMDPIPLARIVSQGAPLPPRENPSRLPAAELPEPDLRNAERLNFSLQAGFADPALDAWAREFGGAIDALCLNQPIFWAINQVSWPGMGEGAVPPPLATLTSGKSYVAEIFNGTPHAHPIHLHGHMFRVVSSNERDTRNHWADTVLLSPKERVEIAFVAGSPGDWMFHCHIIEHQDTGMMGTLRVV